MYIYGNIQYFANVQYNVENERRREQVTFFFHKTLWQKLTGKPADVLIMEKYRGEWVNKFTGEECDTVINARIDYFVRQIKYVRENCYNSETEES